MKHTPLEKRSQYRTEWLQAVFTFLVLVSIYTSTSYFDGYESTLTQPPKKPAIFSGSYWNDTLWYGFRGKDGDTYKTISWSWQDSVMITPDKGVVYDDKTVRVSFYTDEPIEKIERIHNSNLPRTFSRLSNGIAVIEGDLASPTAKNILATLHAR